MIQGKLIHLKTLESQNFLYHFHEKTHAVDSNETTNLKDSNKFFKKLKFYV